MENREITVGEILKNSYNILKEANIDSYNLDCDLLLCKVLEKDRLFLILNRNYILSKDDILEYYRLLELRKNKMPIKYILQECEFMALDFYVKPGVLIPRPDTEVLVECAIEEIKKNNFKKICDVCCGSGAVGLSIAKYVDGVNVFCSDISSTAIEVTNKNVEKLDLFNKVKVIESDLLHYFIESSFKFDLIVSNPPYIRKDVIPTLMEDVKNYEPYGALCGGEDGLIFYRNIVEQSLQLLNKNGMLIFEIGYDQKVDVTNILKQNGFTEIECLKDLAGKNRVIKGRI